MTLVAIAVENKFKDFRVGPGANGDTPDCAIVYSPSFVLFSLQFLYNLSLILMLHISSSFHVALAKCPLHLV